jgi:hypothetical protein
MLWYMHNDDVFAQCVYLIFQNRSSLEPEFVDDGSAYKILVIATDPSYFL